MTIIYMDGFDYADATDLARMGWTRGGGDGIVSGRYGGSAYKTGWGGYFSFSSQSTLAIGFAGYHETGNHMISLRSGTTQHFGIQIYPGAGHLIVNLAGSTHVVNLGFSYYVGLFSHFQIYWVGSTSSTGVFRLWINSRLALDLNNVQTAVSVNTADRIYGDVGVYDDLWITTGELLGDIKVHHLVPNSTVSASWSRYPSSLTANHEAVDELNPNDDTDYVYTSTAGATDVYEFTDLPATASAVRAVGIHTMARKDDAGSRSMRSFLRIGATNYPGATVNLPDSYAWIKDYWLQNPATGTDWTVADVNNLRAGVELIS